MLTVRFDETEIDRIFDAVDQSQLPGAAVAIAVGGVPVYRKGFGLANMELPLHLTPDMRMRIGSTTKHFACLAYMLLVEEGRAALDDEIGRYVPGLKPVNAAATMRRLMGHTSGLRDLLSITMAVHGVNRRVTDAEMLAYYEAIEDCDFPPGERWSYNNGGYMLLTAAIEKIAGQPLDDVLRERIFTPLGMHRTMLRRWDSDFVPGSAALHYRDADGVFSKTHMGMEISGAGGMVSTMDDMLLWLKHMDAPVVGSRETWQLMLAPQKLTSGRSTNYGLGLMCDTYRGAEIIHHAGGVLGGNSQMIKVPGAGLDISIAVNRSDVSAIALALGVIDSCVEGLAPLSAVSVPARYSGTFVSETDGRVLALSVADDIQMMSVDGGAPIALSPDEEGTLQLPAAAASLQQSVRVEGDHLLFSDFGREDRLIAVAGDPDARLGGRAGKYRSAPLDADLMLDEEEGEVRGLMSGRHGRTNYRLQPVTEEIWRLEQIDYPSMSGILRFGADGESLTLDFGRLRHVRFVKA